MENMQWKIEIVILRSPFSVDLLRRGAPTPALPRSTGRGGRGGTCGGGCCCGTRRGRRRWEGGEEEVSHDVGGGRGGVADDAVDVLADEADAEVFGAVVGHAAVGLGDGAEARGVEVAEGAGGEGAVD